ncbi:MAG TPA: MarR family winged helix-turn-helix transcriptional regulator [Gemmatimonadaceae bacterium]
MNTIRALVASLTQSARAIEQDTGITNAQLFVLRELARDEPLSINDVAARAMTRQSTASLLVERLVRAGLVRRAWAADDARRASISLTARGRRIVDRAPEPPTARVIEALQKLPGGRVKELHSGLALLLEHMGVSVEGPLPLFESPAKPARRTKAGRARPRDAGAA